MFRLVTRVPESWQTLIVSDVPQVGAAVVVPGGEGAARPERDRVDALGCGVGKGGGELTGGGVPQVGAAVGVVGGEDAARPERDRQHAVITAYGVAECGSDLAGCR